MCVHKLWKTEVGRLWRAVYIFDFSVRNKTEGVL